MRIASAPNSSNINWTTNSNNHLPSSSASEPHILQSNWPIADQRRRLHYHLINIFPKKDVEEAMAMFPEEANPQKICSAILNIQSLRQQ
jgi:ribonuclease ZC3H12